LITVFNTTRSDADQPIFYGDDLAVVGFDRITHPAIDKLTEAQLGYMWKPDEVNLTKDIKDFRDLTDAEKHIFTSNIKRQTMLDSIQGRSPALAFLPVCSSPELETWLLTWSFMETIHSRSYSYIIQNVYSNPSKVLDSIMDTEQIMIGARTAAKYYDALIKKPGDRKALVRALYAVAALEGVRFFVSFACSWAFTEQKRVMEGNAKLIKLIARDENLHFAGVKHIMKVLETYPQFKEVIDICQPDAISIFAEVAEQERAWCEYLFSKGSMIGLNQEILSNYVDWLTSKRMRSLGLPTEGYVSPVAATNPLPWTSKWIAGHDVQNASQETTLVSYSAGGMKMDLDGSVLQGLKL
jgi:ribonucleoside-diphosphate reductase beta chain